MGFSIHCPAIYAQAPESLASGSSRNIFTWSHAVVPSRIRQSFRVPISYQRGGGRVGPLANRRNALALSCRPRATPSKGEIEKHDQNGTGDAAMDAKIQI